MEELKVIGVESGSLLVASEEGTRYRVAIDDVLQSRLRQSLRETVESQSESSQVASLSEFELSMLTRIVVAELDAAQLLIRGHLAARRRVGSWRSRLDRTGRGRRRLRLSRGQLFLLREAGLG